MPHGNNCIEHLSPALHFGASQVADIGCIDTVQMYKVQIGSLAVIGDRAPRTAEIPIAFFL